MMSTNTRIGMLKMRKNILTQRDAAGNANLIRKINRQLRKLEETK